MPCDSIITMSVDLSHISEDLLEQLFPEICNAWGWIEISGGVQIRANIRGGLLTVMTSSQKEKEEVKARIMTQVQRHVVAQAATKYGWMAEKQGTNKLVIRR